MVEQYFVRDPKNTKINKTKIYIISIHETKKQKKKKLFDFVMFVTR